MKMLTHIDSNEKHPTWQALCNIAYERWQEGGDLHGKTYDVFVEQLDDIFRIAVQLKNLNYQVENGGFLQWEVNGFSIDCDEIQDAIQTFISTPACLEVLDIVQCWVGDVGFLDETLETFKKASRYAHFAILEDSRDEFEEFIYKKRSIVLGELDKRYYGINKEFMDDIEKFFASTDEGKNALATCNMLGGLCCDA